MMDVGIDCRYRLSHVAQLSMVDRKLVPKPLNSQMTKWPEARPLTRIEFAGLHRFLGTTLDGRRGGA